MVNIIINSILALVFTEYAGNMFHNNNVSLSAKSPSLKGTYANAMVGLSSLSLLWSAMYIFLFSRGMYVNRNEAHMKRQKIFWTVLLLAIILGFSVSVMNIHVVHDYQDLLNGGHVKPSLDVPGENFKLRGVYGTALVSVASITLGCGTLGLIQLALGRYLLDRDQVFMII
jgi:hypothetical protein